MDPSAPPAQPPASALTTPAQVGGTPVLGAAWGPGPSPGGVAQTTHAPRSYLAPNSLNGAYQQRWGSSLTPLALTAAIKSADLGTMFPLADLLDEVRETDPHVQATLAKREWVVAGAEWEVRPSRAYEAGQEPDVAREARELCASVLRALPALPDRFADLMGAVYYGRAVVEVVWERQGGYLIPSRLYPVHPRMIQYDAGWNLRLWSNMPPFPFGAYPGIAVQDAVPGRFIVHTPRIRGGANAGISAGPEPRLSEPMNTVGTSSTTAQLPLGTSGYAAAKGSVANAENSAVRRCPWPLRASSQSASQPPAIEPPVPQTSNTRP